MTFTKTTDLAGDKVTRQRVWNRETVRTMCINWGFYNCGDTEDYSKLLDYVDDHAPTTKAMYIAAKNIAAHSKRKDMPRNEQIAHIMFCLEKDAVITYFDVKEEELDELSDDSYGFAAEF